MLVLNADTGASMVQDNTITSAKLVDNAITSAKIVDGAVGDTKVNFTANNPEVKEALNASGTAPIYACRAWVNFNGEGTVAIRASGNVSSITDNGVGDYTVNFTTAMPDANYGVSGFARNTQTGVRNDAIGIAQNLDTATYTSTSVRFYAYYVNEAVAARIDSSLISLAVFR